jgi:hypothetical protein
VQISHQQEMTKQVDELNGTKFLNFFEMLQTECDATIARFEIVKSTCLKIYALASSLIITFCDFPLYHVVK